QVGVFLNVHVQLGQLVVGDGDQFGVAAGFVGHVEDTDRAAADDRTRCNRIGGYYQHVQRVAVVGKGVRDEAVVGRVEHRGGHETVDEQAVGVVIDFVLDRRVVGRDLDGDIDVVGQVFAGRDFAVAHEH